MAFEFKMRATDKDKSGYYYTRWDRAIPLTVIADNRSEAFKKCWALLGDSRRGSGWTWTAHIDSIKEVKDES